MVKVMGLWTHWFVSAKNRGQASSTVSVGGSPLFLCLFIFRATCSLSFCSAVEGVPRDGLWFTSSCSAGVIFSPRCHVNNFKFPHHWATTENT